MAENERKFKLADNAVLRVGDDGRAILVDLATGALFSLNRTCALVCLAIKDSPRSFGEVISAISSRMSLPVEAEEDIKTFLQQLGNKKLLILSH